MRNILLSVVAASTILVAGGDIAAIDGENKPYYIGVGVSANETSSEMGGSNYLGHSAGEFTNMGIQLSAGYKLHEREKIKTYVELKAGHSFWMEDGENFSTTNVGVFIKPSYELVTALNIYGLVGIANIQWDGRGETANGTGIALGAGGSLYLSESVAIFGEYVGYPVDSKLEYLNAEVNYQVLTLGVTYEW